jgi:Heparinase II/III-like protein/Heparinase II/III N-terminus
LKPLQRLRQAAGRSPGYIARRGLTEIGRRLRSSRLRRNLQTLTPADVARLAGVENLSALWERRAAKGFLFSAAERDELRRLHEGPFASSAEVLQGRVERILRHEFDLLGSGPIALGPELDWHLDFKSGRRWDLTPSERIDVSELDSESDVKVPWELSRGQHLTALARSWVVSGDARSPREFESEVRAWIRDNPVGLGVNWIYAMDVGLRALSWIWSLALFDGAPFSAGFRDEILCSLYVHGRWIPRHLERGEVSANHLLADALGLVACGIVFTESGDGTRWLAQGHEILEREILQQVGEDGVDFEGSVPYHRLVLEIFVVGARLLESAGREPSERYRARLEKMFEFVHACVTPEGLSPVVGDADDGRAIVLGETAARDHRYLLSTGAALFGRPEWKARAGFFRDDSLWLLGPRAYRHFEEIPAIDENESRSFADSGFSVLRTPEQYLFVDAGPVGSRGTGGHGHNDCLSFEWHARGKPLLTDSGSFVYTASPEWRNRFRSTEFHNTIRVDECEINRIPSPLSLWSLSNDAKPVGVRLVRTPDAETLEAGHTGYRRLPAPVTVFRTFSLDRGAPRLRITDRLDGTGVHLVEFFFHAAPGAVAKTSSTLAVELVWPDSSGVTIQKAVGPDVHWEVRPGWFAPSYGIKHARPVWVALATLQLPFTVEWELTARS